MSSATTAPPFQKVIVVGSGPAGLLLSLFLAKKGIPVTILEASDKLDSRPRATHYAAPAVHQFARAGVIDIIKAEGIVPNALTWRKLDGTYVAGLDVSVLDDSVDKVICLPLDKLGKVLYDAIKKLPNSTVLWQHKVTDIGQDDEKAWVFVNTPTGQRRFEADYIIGCDGGRSQIRRSLFGDRNFPGTTWGNQNVATNTYYDLHKFGLPDVNNIMHPDDWYIAARISKDGLWRIAYGEPAGLSEEEIIARQPEKFERMLPGHPKPDQYKVVAMASYRTHQRIVDKMRVGRFMLAGDAAHLCSPAGGLGLTGGILDVAGLSDCLIGMYEGKADSTILDKYSEDRRKVFMEVVDPISSTNFRRLCAVDPDKAIEEDEFLQAYKKAEGDVKLSQVMQSGLDILGSDFTKYYKQ